MSHPDAGTASATILAVAHNLDAAEAGFNALEDARLLDEWNPDTGDDSDHDQAVRAINWLRNILAATSDKLSAD